MNKNDYNTVHNHTKKIMPVLEKSAMKALPYPYLSLTHSKHYTGAGIWCWDSHHMAMRFAYAGKPEYFKFFIDNLIHYQTDDGFMPNSINPNDGIVKLFTGFQSQPFLMQSALMYLSRTNDLKWIKERFDKLKQYLKYYETNCSAPYGLFRWPNSWMGGIDNDVVTTFSQLNTIISVDINAWIYLEYRATSVLARKLKRKNDFAVFSKKAKRLCAAVNKTLWYDKMNSYSAYNLCTNKHQFHYCNQSTKKPIGRYLFQSCSNLIPLYARMADKEKAIRMIKEYVLSENHFLSPYGIRSLSKSSEYYNNAIWGNPTHYSNHSNSNWQGPVWFLPTYFMFHALMYYGFKKEAKNLADRLINLFALSIKKIGSFTENYNADTGEPLYASGMASWNILADMLYHEMGKNTWIMNPIFDEIDR